MLKLRLAEIATQKGLSKKDIHFETRLSFPTIQRYWDNTAKQIDLEVLEAFCRFLNCTPGDMIQLTDAKLDPLTVAATGTVDKPSE